MSVGYYCKRSVVTASKQDSIVTAAQLMRQNHIGCLVIVEDTGAGNQPVGVLTDRDLVVEILAAEINPDDVTVGDIMSFELLTAWETDSIWETLQRMRVKGVRRVPVVDQKGLLTGILSSDDLLEVLSEELSQLAKLSNREQQRESAQRSAG
ncbi:MAG: CBS domain-containing protein [Methylococcaceae bacterium]|nr:CBS domain-containing protein [Methylococcaceae bacterium]